MKNQGDGHDTIHRANAIKGRDGIGVGIGFNGDNEPAIVGGGMNLHTGRLHQHTTHQRGTSGLRIDNDA